MQELKAWLGQVTTGHGVMIIAPTLLAVVSGTMTWQTAVPLLVAGMVGLFWPENTDLAATLQDTAAHLVTGVTAVQAAYLKGVDHGNAAAAPPAPAPVVVVPPPGGPT